MLGLLSATALLLADSKLTQAALLAVTVWAFCKLYYFRFYVIEHYVDPSFRFRGLWDFVRYMFRKRRGAGALGALTTTTSQDPPAQAESLRQAEV